MITVLLALLLAGNTPPLVQAAANGNLVKITVQLDGETNVNVTDGNGWTAVMWAAQRSWLDVLVELSSAGADLTKKGPYGRNAMRLAAETGHVEIVRWLCSKGLHASSVDSYGFTPLMKAAGSGYLEVVQTLLKCAAKPNKKSQAGLTALHLAADGGYQRISKLLTDAGATSSPHPLAKYAKERVKRGHGQKLETALLNASKQGDLTKLRKLIDQGAKTNTENDDGYTPLILAADRGRDDCVAVLISHGARIDAAYGL